MKLEPKSMTVADVLELKRNGMLSVDAEYQRGMVWGEAQKKKLIDSVLRGYPLPMIYLHHIKREIAGMTSQSLAIVDGQQRINALYEFSEGAFKLFDPVKDEAKARFPRFLKLQTCPWGGKDFASLSDELKQMFLTTHLAVAQVETGNPNEVRDLFVRLQAGLPLNSQEARDAWPGGFAEFVLKLGGKPELPRYPGHEFFRKVMHMKPGADRGKTRQFAAQIAILALEHHASGVDGLRDINSKAIDDYYHENLDFDVDSAAARRLVQVLDKLTELLGSAKVPKLHAHDAIHVVLLVDSLWDEYTRGWEDRITSALLEFLKQLNAATKDRASGTPNEHWLRYGQWARVNSDRGDSIRLRHRFYLEKMLALMQPLTMRDPQRAYGPIEREYVFFRDGGVCKVCGSKVSWGEVEIHHVVEHWQGGPTALENGVLVHRHCHPKGTAAAQFATLPIVK